MRFLTFFVCASLRIYTLHNAYKSRGILTSFFCTPKNENLDFSENSRNTRFSNVFAIYVMYEIDKNVT